MAIFKFMHTPKPRAYKYNPQYYDQQKEDLQSRLSGASESQDDEDPELIKLRISRGFKQKFRQDAVLRKKQTKLSNIRLIITIVVLLFLSYMLLIKYLPDIEKLLG